MRKPCMRTRQPFERLVRTLLLFLSGSLFAADVPAAPPVAVTVRSTKLIYDPGDPITGTVTVTAANPSGVYIVRAWLEAELDLESKARERKAIFQPAAEPTGVAAKPAGYSATVSVSFPTGLAKYGHALVAEVLQDGKVVARGEDYFNVCDNYWNVALIAAQGFIWEQFDNFKPRKDTKWIDGIVARLRREYFNGFEKFFWAPDDFLELTPDKEIWWSGQARYLETKSGLRGLIARAHENGMKAITYAKLTGGGPTGAEIARRHPEWVWIWGGTLAVDRQAKALAEWDITSEKHWGGWVPVNWNMNDPKVVDLGIKELCDSTAMFGWDGARWDGNFDVASEVYDLEGRLVEKLTREQMDARNAANMRRTKETISRLYPRFVYGYNWTQGNWAQSMAASPRESTELCRGGGLIMNEYINQAEGVQHPLHRWEDFARTCLDDVERIKALGGYYGPILSSPDTPDGRYTNVFAYAAGAHPYYHHLWGAFMTRYSAFCWDNALRRIHNPESLLLAPSSVWWRDWVFERPIRKNCKELIVHLINPPLKPTVGEGKKPEDMAPPVREVAVSIFPTLLNGWRPTRATRLCPEPMLRESVPIELREGIYTIPVPEVVLWTILVIDLER